MEPFLNAAMILISIALIAVILLQIRGEGSGAFGAAQSTFRVRRGVEVESFMASLSVRVGIQHSSVPERSCLYL